jgi:hypothetical protein
MGRRFAIGLLVAALGSGVGFGSAWAWSPGFREAALLAGLASGIDPLQYQSAYLLQEHPTERAVLALIAFVNLAHEPPVERTPWERLLARPHEVSEPELLERIAALREWECVEPSADRAALLHALESSRESLEHCVTAELDAEDAARERARELARRALYSVCVLTGEAFGTDFDPLRNGYGTLAADEWRASLSELNLWNAQTFGAELPGELVESSS